MFHYLASSYCNTGLVSRAITMCDQHARSLSMKREANSDTIFEISPEFSEKRSEDRIFFYPPENNIDKQQSSTSKPEIVGYTHN